MIKITNATLLILIYESTSISIYEPKNTMAILSKVFSENEIPPLKIALLITNKLFIIKPIKIAIATDPKVIKFDK